MTSARRGLLIAFALASFGCGRSGEEGSGWYLTKKADMRDGLTHLCQAVSVARADSAAAHTGDLLFRAAGELPHDWVSGPVFYELMNSVADVDAETRRDRLTAAVEEAGLTSECTDLFYALGPGALTNDAAAIPAAERYAARGFEIDNHGKLHPWHEGHYAEVWAQGGVALTPEWHQGDRARVILSITAVDVELDACEAQAKTYLESIGRRLGRATLTRWSKLDDKAGVPVCLFVAEVDDGQPGLSAAVVALDFATLRMVCEHDTRWRDDLDDCAMDIRSSVTRPAGAPAPSAGDPFDAITVHLLASR